MSGMPIAPFFYFSKRSMVSIRPKFRTSTKPTAAVINYYGLYSFSGHILHVRQHVGIHVEGKGDAGMPELLADDLGRHSGGQ